METPSPTFSSFTFAPVRRRVGVMPARESCAVSAIVKHPAWAAPISSSGLVAAWPSSNRDLNEYGPSKAPLPTFSRPLPWARFPFHSASALCVGIKVSFGLAPQCFMIYAAKFVVPGRPFTRQDGRSRLQTPERERRIDRTPSLTLRALTVAEPTWRDRSDACRGNRHRSVCPRPRCLAPFLSLSVL